MLSPDAVQTIATIAFCLEPLGEKPGCTTRTVDIAGKPLTDFLIAGIGVGATLRYFAEAVLADERTPIFAEYAAALRASTQFKSPKIISMGLLEIMFPVIYARLRCEDRTHVVDAVIAGMRRESAEDVALMIEARGIAWETSGNPAKQAFNGAAFAGVKSPWEFYECMHALPGGPESSYQWAEEYFNGLPILRQVLVALEGIADATTMVDATAEVHRAVIAERPQVKVGMVADMCAAGLFLHMSFLSNWN